MISGWWDRAPYRAPCWAWSLLKILSLPLPLPSSLSPSLKKKEKERREEIFTCQSPFHKHFCKSMRVKQGLLVTKDLKMPIVKDQMRVHCNGNNKKFGYFCDIQHLR